MIGTFALRPSSAKRLIARGISQMPEVLKALSEGKMIITGGTTNAFVMEELGIIKIEEKGSFTGGVITDGLPCTTDPNRVGKFPVCLDKGQIVDVPWQEFIYGFKRDDVFIKGANAIDAEGNAGILLGSPNGGTIGMAIGILTALGSHLIVPVGHEKMIPSCREASEKLGILRIDQSLGMRTGFMLLSDAKVVTEIQALENLIDVKATVVAAGGIGGMEGSTVMAVEGEELEVERALNLARMLMKEKPIKGFKRLCKGCPLPCSFPNK